jgi:hypothetical protein
MAKKKKDPILDPINKELKKVTNKIIKPIDKGFKKVSKEITKPVDKIVGYFKCGINKIKNLGDCILFYIVDMFIAMYFLLWNMFATVFGLKKAGQSLWKFINKYQQFKYPKSIMKKCYLC